MARWAFERVIHRGVWVAVVVVVAERQIDRQIQQRVRLLKFLNELRIIGGLHADGVNNIAGVNGKIAGETTANLMHRFADAELIGRTDARIAKRQKCAEIDVKLTFSGICAALSTPRLAIAEPATTSIGAFGS